ncbi:MAG TPA: glycosyltransferase [Rhizomicrobium sp.]
MKTAIIIATHRRPALLERLLGDLAQNALPPDSEVRVVENGAPGGAQGICERNDLGGKVHYSYQQEGRKSTALNRAVRDTAADFLIFFDDDVSVPPNIVQTYCNAALRRGPGNFFGGPLTADAEVSCPVELADYLPRSAIGWRPGDLETVMSSVDFEYFFGANWAVFRQDLAQAGLFAEELGITASRYSPLGEETEIQARLVETGVRPVYLPGAPVCHHVPRECYTARWVWRRRFRLGVTDWTRTERAQQARCRTVLGVPAWLVRATAQQKLRVALSWATSANRQTDLRMRDAYLSGLLYGAWTAQPSRQQTEK